MVAMANGGYIYIYALYWYIKYQNLSRTPTYFLLCDDALENFIDDMSESGESLKAKAN